MYIQDHEVPQCKYLAFYGMALHFQWSFETKSIMNVKCDGDKKKGPLPSKLVTVN